ncbi:unnamed protein product [Macrosiphum euphorbiae]|uniref:Secreted protein n=1 Tax=Macrosiphum euphorbiae TaxID=13131 RepID=A0AAV0XRG9_9HEMI|nr:unnamed protein product [Macrosiphum euphorbiae]
MLSARSAVASVCRCLLSFTFCRSVPSCCAINLIVYCDSLGMDFGLPNGFVRVQNRTPFKVNVNFSIRQSIRTEERSRAVRPAVMHSISNLIRCFHLLLWLW